MDSIEVVVAYRSQTNESRRIANIKLPSVNSNLS